MKTAETSAGEATVELAGLRTLALVAPAPQAFQRRMEHR